MEHIWRKPWSYGKVLFLLSRWPVVLEGVLFLISEISFRVLYCQSNTFGRFHRLRFEFTCKHTLTNPLCKWLKCFISIMNLVVCHPLFCYSWCSILIFSTKSCKITTLMDAWASLLFVIPVQCNAFLSRLHKFKRRLTES